MKEGKLQRGKTSKRKKKRKTERGRDEEKERWPLLLQQHTGTELREPRQDSMSCLFVSIDQPIKGLWWEAYWFWRPKGQSETKIKQDRGGGGVELLSASAATRLQDEKAL